MDFGREDGVKLAPKSIKTSMLKLTTVFLRKHVFACGKNKTLNVQGVGLLNKTRWKIDQKEANMGRKGLGGVAAWSVFKPS